MTELVENKCALITGASAGIGAATAKDLAARGAKVVLVARSADKLNALAKEITAAGGEAVAQPTDVSNYEAVRAAVATCVDRFGGLDLLLNNAGVIDPIARLADSDPDEWGKVVDINFKGVYYGLHAAIPAMLGPGGKSGGGTIINISSGAATGALEGWSHYCSTKAAVLSLTKCVHKEYGEQGIRVIGLSPGTVATAMQTAIKSSGVNPVSQLDWSAHIPPEWVAKTIAYLYGPGGDDFLGTDFSLKTDEGRALVGLPDV